MARRGRFSSRYRTHHRRKATWEVYNVELGNILLYIIVGGIAGFLASKVMTGHGMGLIWDIVVGIVGAFVGGWLAGVLFHIAVSNFVVLFIVAFIGAVILLAIFRAVAGSRGRSHA
jgi:uncharacterized membrane protein YeaQ/YmgE (transglycosylase-associated protein family)